MKLKHPYVSAEKFILSREFFGMKLGLENITGFLHDIDCPQDQYGTIHLAGTNGKGSTAAMLASILRASGYRTGLFTSPHLVTLRERAQINGRMIPRPSVTAFVKRHRRELTRRKLSFFEVITAMALEHFARGRVEVAVIETGLGGRLDATNVLSPLLTLTTDISFDHIEILGPTLARIAREKAGIIKPGTPHLAGLLPPEAEKVIRERCRRLKAPLHSLSTHDFRIDTPSGRLDFIHNGSRLERLRPGLIGRHQFTNAALAVRAATILKEQGLRITNNAIRQGLTGVKWPGRFQIIRRRGKPTLVLDVGHNAAGVRAFVDSFQTTFPDRRAHVITGFVKAKSHQAMFDALGEIAADLSIVPLKTRRSIDLDELVAKTDFGAVPFRTAGSLGVAYRRLLKSCSRDDIVIVAGSHYLVGEFIEKFG